MSALEELYENKLLRDIDLHFAKAVAASFRTPEAELLLALVFATTKDGHTSLDTAHPEIMEFYKEHKSEIDQAVSAKNITDLTKKGLICNAPEMHAPFILSGSKLYMKSFYTDESGLADFIKTRKGQISAPSEKLIKLLNKYFPENGMQKAAALNAAINSLTVISGGPGTGKTTTVFGLLSVLSELFDKTLRIAVCAPTGKAAARLTETLTEQETKQTGTENIPDKAVTIHRLLGMTGESRRPTYGSYNKLPYDIVVTDEASMVDIRLMARLTSALSDECRLILLGDKDQLASVQPGAVMGDICSVAPVESFSKERAGILEQAAGKKLITSVSPYADITVMLDRSYRYDSGKGIGLLAAACAKGDADTALQVLTSDSTGQVDFIELGDDFEKVAGGLILSRFKECISADDPAGSLKEFNNFRILTPHRKQAGGTDHINAIAEKVLFHAGLYDNTKRFYHGMPFMITENDYTQNLFNGETGLILNHDGLKAFLPQQERVRELNPMRLPGHVPAFSMTVHKSQGSEFEHVVFVLTDTDSRILTRELFYTAVTRAKSRLTVISSIEAVRRCLSETTFRTGGLIKGT